MTRRRRGLTPSDVGTLSPAKDEVHFDAQLLGELAEWLEEKARLHAGMPAHVAMFERYATGLRHAITAHEALGDRLVEHDAEYRAHLGTCHRASPTPNEEAERRR